jgi:hypothetical protein
MFLDEPATILSLGAGVGGWGVSREYWRFCKVRATCRLHIITQEHGQGQEGDPYLSFWAFIIFIYWLSMRRTGCLSFWDDHNIPGDILWRRQFVFASEMIIIFLVAFLWRRQVAFLQRWSQYPWWHYMKTTDCLSFWDDHNIPGDIIWRRQVAFHFEISSYSRIGMGEKP